MLAHTVYLRVTVEVHARIDDVNVFNVAVEGNGGFHLESAECGRRTCRHVHQCVGVAENDNLLNCLSRHVDFEVIDITQSDRVYSDSLGAINGDAVGAADREISRVE